MDLVAASNKYKETRESVHKQVVATFRNSNDASLAHLTITTITPHALAAFGRWKHSLRRVNWNWSSQVNHFREKRPSHWEMAIWHKQTLCGLVLGGPSRKRTRLYVEGIEGNPEGSPLKSKIIPIALLASERYAESIGCSEVWLVDPAEAILDRYVKAGYTLRLPNKFLARIFGKKSFAIKVVGAKL